MKELIELMKETELTDRINERTDRINERINRDGGASETPSRCRL